MQLDGQWVLDVHLDTHDRTVFLTATDREAQTVHFAKLELLTVTAVQGAVKALISQHGRPTSVLTDHGALWEGLHTAIDVPQLRPSQPTSDAWMQRLARAVAA